MLPVLGLSLAAMAQAPPAKPNVLFIVVDDMNDYVGMLESNPDAVTPTLDGLAARGTSFTNAYCNSPQCSPSRASFLSGKLPGYSGIHQAGDYNNSDFRSNFGSKPVFTLPEVLKDSGGYVTVAASKVFHGKRHNPPITDIDYDSTGSDDCNRGKSWSDWLNVTTLDPIPTAAETYGLQGYDWGRVSDNLEVELLDAKAVQAATDWIDDYATDPSQFCDRPFFLAVGIFRPHIPFFNPWKYFPEAYQPNIYQYPYTYPYNNPPNASPRNGTLMPMQAQVPYSDYDNLPFIGQVNANGHSTDNPWQGFLDYAANISPTPVVQLGLTPAEREQVISEAYRANALQSYLAGINFVDAQIGQLLATLESHPDLFENTIVVLFSDHGFGMGEKKHWGKSALWDQNLRVPMIVVDPRKGGNQVVHTPVSLIDLFPTLLDLTGTPHPVDSTGTPYLDGLSFVPQLNDPTMPRSFPSISSYELTHSNYVDGTCWPYHSIRNERFHYIRYFTNGAVDSQTTCDLANRRVQEELYEIGAMRDVDPNEWHNLATDPAYADVLSEMAQFLPEGALYLEQPGRVQILHDTLDCVVNIKTDNHLQAAWFHPDGTIDPGTPTGFVFEWTGDALPAPVAGRILNVRRNNLDSAFAATAPELVFTVTATDTTRNVSFSDVIRLQAQHANTPLATYLVARPEQYEAQITNLNITGDYDNVVWDFGDGFVTDEYLPATHMYTLPGDFTIQAIVQYGNDPRRVCEKKTNTTISVSTISMNSLPCLPISNIEVSDIDPTSARVDWIGTYKTIDYGLRIRETTPDNSGPWLQGERFFPFIKARGLEPNTDYTFHVRSICAGAATDTSEWSVPVRFRTKSCYGPHDVAVGTVTSTTMDVGWSPFSTEIDAHEVIGLPVAGGPKFKVQSLGAHSTTVTGLTPGTDYEFKVRPFCRDAAGTPRIKGPLGPTYYFSTPSIRAEDASGLALQPNPASDQLTVTLPAGWGAERSLVVTDLLGRTIRAAQPAEDQLQIHFDTRDWPAGTYLIELTDGRRDASAKAVVAR